MKANRLSPFRIHRVEDTVLRTGLEHPVNVLGRLHGAHKHDHGRRRTLVDRSRERQPLFSRIDEHEEVIGLGQIRRRPGGTCIGVVGNVVITHVVFGDVVFGDVVPPAVQDVGNRRPLLRIRTVQKNVHGRIWRASSRDECGREAVGDRQGGSGSYNYCNLQKETLHVTLVFPKVSLFRTENRIPSLHGSRWIPPESAGPGIAADGRFVNRLNGDRRRHGSITSPPRARSQWRSRVPRWPAILNSSQRAPRLHFL